jgi:hypothetical protein
MITNRFSPLYPVSASQGRHGELIVVQGHGTRPVRWDGAGAGKDAGIFPPESPLDIAYSHVPEGMSESDLPHPVKPTPGPGEVPAEGNTRGRITINPDKHYYIARTDVYRPGNVYYAPPEVSYSSDAPIVNGRGRPCEAQAYLERSAVSEVRVKDGGKYYPKPPTVVLSDTHGKGAVLRAVLDAPEIIETPGNDFDTGLTGYSIISQPPWPDEAAYPAGYETRYGIYPLVDIPIDSNGDFDVLTPWYGCNILLDNGNYMWFPNRYRCLGSISGLTSGSGAVLRLNGLGIDCLLPATSIANAVPLVWGQGYSASDDIIIRVRGLWTLDPETGGTIRPAPANKDIVIRAFSGANEDNPGVTPYPIKDIVIESRGDGYLVAPDLKITSKTGFGAVASCTVKDGQIDTVTIENKGGGYTTPPKVEILSGGAEAFAISRPHLRGTYQCYYRYVDDTPEDRGGPIPSNLSPVAEVDCAEGATSLTWNVPQPSGRGTKAELWRSTANQALTLYRVATVTGQHFDDLTDDELRDEERDGYAAMPIVLPNGELNANRFTPPPDDKATVVRFQDRHWYAVDTGGQEPNSIFFSEVDEPESVPKENELVLQQNARDSDFIRALVPFGATLLVLQERHAYALSFSKQPLLDAQVTPVAYRGCLNQRCWEIYDGTCYAMDQYGIYAISQAGQVEAISDPIENVFRDSVDFSATRWCFVTIDPKSQSLRAFVALKGDNAAGKPTAALCFSLELKSWWIERYPQEILAGTNIRLSNAEFRCVYAGQTGCYLLDEGPADVGRGSVTSVTLTSKGSGYKTPPEVTAPGGTAAEFEASINAEGEVTAIWIKNAGFGYESGSLAISPPDDAEHGTPVSAAATFEATPLSSGSPMYPVYRYKTGNSALPTDDDDPRRGASEKRNVTLTYKPKKEPCVASLRTYYNNAESPRPNVAFMDRGTGFYHSMVDNAVRIDFGANHMEYSADTGVASALFSGHALGDIRSTDRHMAVELVGPSKGQEPVVVYELKVLGAEG